MGPGCMPNIRAPVVQHCSAPSIAADQALANFTRHLQVYRRSVVAGARCARLLAAPLLVYPRPVVSR